MPTTSTTHQLFQGFPGDFYSRRLLSDTPLYQPSNTATPPAPGNTASSEPYTSSTDSSFDANVVMVLAVLLCALICSLGLNSIIRCALKFSNLVVSESAANPSTQKANTGSETESIEDFPNSKILC
ncbi:hypothetical protein OIU77_016520 [Salix suchowensis]|uniref:RING-type E3 ubiquitin transferase n=1 Tax=Salix suchowensis TaxID=1278906 RepID=A0ABQ8ZKM1_9ROSI|nr:hypothetical protein OIU77_016520 [Salix suchowensis]